MGSALVESVRLLAAEADRLRFGPHVACVYNPLVYAWEPHLEYLRRFGGAPKEVVLLGMNPGPFGMAQTGVPFGDVEMVRGWLGIEGRVERPPSEHPKRPVAGFACRRGEVSGRRFWGWARDTWGTPDRFFARFLVLNYCPLAFLDESGRNVTPDKLPAPEREALFAVCDRALVRALEILQPRFAVGIGGFAKVRLQLLAGEEVKVGWITHPSPANPRANQDWAALAGAELRELGVKMI